MTLEDATSRDPKAPRLRAPQRRRLYEQLATQLVSFVEVSGLEVGDKLPSERELAVALQVSRVSLRQATVSLEVQGVLEVRHGGGIYLRSLPRDRLPRVELMTRRHRLPEILEAREALETQLAALAAVRRTDDDLRAIDKSLVTMSDDIEAGGLGVHGDELFHAAITAAARSTLLGEFMEALAPAIAESRFSSLAEPNRPPRSLAGHRRIADAIRRGDPAAARRTMRSHLKMVSDVGLLRWQAASETPGS